MTPKKVSPFFISVIIFIVALIAYLFYMFQNDNSKLPIVREAPALIQIHRKFYIHQNQGRLAKSTILGDGPIQSICILFI